MRDLREGIGSPDITAHDLRRSGATRLAIAGVSPFILSKLLNHAGDFGGGSPITMAVYVQHNYMAEKRAAIIQLETLLLAVVNPSSKPASDASDYAAKARSALRFHNPGDDAGKVTSHATESQPSAPLGRGALPHPSTDSLAHNLIDRLDDACT